MRLLTNLLFKVTLSSMVLASPAVLSGNTNDEAGRNFARLREAPLPFFSSAVIKRFVDHPTVIAMRAFPKESTAEGKIVEVLKTVEVVRTISAVKTGEAAKVMEAKTAEVKTAEVKTAEAKEVAAKTVESKRTDAKAAELRRVINQAVYLYTAMDLQNIGLDEKAFEYAWRGYHNLVKKGVIHKRAILSICDFSQPSRNKRMYVIDVLHRRLLYRTYVAHGQNSGDEFADAFSNQPDSYMSSLGFYITQRTYVGRNGLSLRLDGVDSGYNDLALKRNIVLHGASYATEKYMQDYGNLGTSLGCPALPVDISGRIIRTVKNGSCLFIYHPTEQYLEHSTVLHG
jgi:hypothetical protein